MSGISGKAERRDAASAAVLMRRLCLRGVIGVLALTNLTGLAAPCQATDIGVRSLSHRLEMEAAADKNPFLLVPHRPNYILPAVYSSDPNAEVLGLAEGELDKVEMFFQVSLKLKLDEDFAGTGGALYAAYTNRSWWQAYNARRSRPFRETNHEPELFLLFDKGLKPPGFHDAATVIGVSHQSNGQSGEFSRSWNRVYADLIMERRSMVISFKPWYRIPERDKRSPDDPGGDDNPDINHYMGRWELGVLAFRGNSNFTVLLRNNMSRDNKGALELGWSYPLSIKLKGFVQLFDGYGDSLIDYNHRTTRIGIGILLADWL